MYHVAWEGGGPGGSGGGRRRGRLRRGGRETQTGDQGSSIMSCPKFIDKLVGQTMRQVENCVRHSYNSYFLFLYIYSFK